MAKVKAIVVEINGKQVNLSLKEAKSLAAELDAVLGKIETVKVPCYPYPYAVPTPRPYWERTWLSTDTKFIAESATDIGNNSTYTLSNLSQ